MVIDLKEMARRGEVESPFRFEFEPPIDLMIFPDGKFSGGAVIEGVAERYPDKVYLSGTLTFTVSADCSRCLKPAEKTLIVEFDEEFRPAPCADEDVFTYEKDRINVEPLIEQLILTNMPCAVYCKDDCKGLCPTCGKDLNEGDCGCDNN